MEPADQSSQPAVPHGIKPAIIKAGIPLPELHFEKRCTRCGELKPADAYPLMKPNGIYKVKPGQRSGVCKKCKRNREIERLFRKLERERTEYVLRKGNQVNRIEAPHVAQQCEGVMRLFSGLEGYVKFWYAQIMEAASQKPGSRLVLDQCKEINKLIVNSTTHRQTAPDVQYMAPDEMESEMRRLVVELAADHPDEIGEVLETLAIPEADMEVGPDEIEREDLLDDDAIMEEFLDGSTESAADSTDSAGL